MRKISGMIDRTPVWVHGPVLIICMLLAVFLVPTLFGIFILAVTSHIPLINEAVQNVLAQ